ncbi:predicted protein [Lichtheimia corymbifera JMRC:FSU:9682]|uniref:Uncharacterized protein n=1 Tax=Lichtheimia corymbifera JMRC:FSU:9682 TaxID=1263082 RepID=A0A068S9J3_9FUNG|nr:predicted protein [Lichtheimia corymbifera JMRC:FSU:9682]
MKFTTLIFAVLVLAISAANAVKEQAVLEFLPASPEEFSLEYKIRVSLLWSGTSYEIALYTQVPTLIASYPTTSTGMVEFDEPPNGPYNAVINDNATGGSRKTFRLDLTGPGADFYFKGESVTNEWIDDLSADAFVSPITGDDFRYSHPRLHHSQQHRYPCKH